MNSESAVKFLEALGAKAIKYDGNTWVRSQCILARWTHKGGSDHNPSFGVNVGGMKPYYHCFSCRSGSLTTLIQELEMFASKGSGLNGSNTKLARSILENSDIDIVPLPEFSEFVEHGKPFQEWPSYFVDSFVGWELSARARAYLSQRGVGSSTANTFGLRYDSKRDMVVFPYYNLYGKLSGARGRAVELNGEPKRTLKHFDYTWNGVNNAELVWFNEQVLALEQPVVIVEGQFDALRVSEVYPYVIANMTAKPVYGKSRTKIKKLAQASAIVLMLDNDEAADIAVGKYLSVFESMDCRVAVVESPKVIGSDGKLIKTDPDSLGTDWIKEQLVELGLI